MFPAGCIFFVLSAELYRQLQCSEKGKKNRSICNSYVHQIVIGMANLLQLLTIYTSLKFCLVNRSFTASYCGGQGLRKLLWVALKGIENNLLCGGHGQFWNFWFLNLIYYFRYFACGNMNLSGFGMWNAWNKIPQFQVINRSTNFNTIW